MYFILISGLIFVRSFYDSFRDQDTVHWMKLSYKNTESGNDYSYFKIPVSEVSELIQNIQFILSEIANAKEGEIIPMLKSSPFSDVTDREDIGRFWNRSHSLYLKSGKVAVRPFLNFDGLYNLKMWYPKQAKHNWNGPQITFYIGQAKTFCRFLKEIEREVANGKNMID